MCYTLLSDKYLWSHWCHLQHYAHFVHVCMYSAMEMALCMFADYVLHKACCTVEPLSVPFYFLPQEISQSSWLDCCTGNVLLSRHLMMASWLLANVLMTVDFVKKGSACFEMCFLCLPLSRFYKCIYCWSTLYWSINTCAGVGAVHAGELYIGVFFCCKYWSGSICCKARPTCLIACACPICPNVFIYGLLSILWWCACVLV